jgi:hypothetical protein
MDLESPRCKTRWFLSSLRSQMSQITFSIFAGLWIRLSYGSPTYIYIYLLSGERFQSINLTPRNLSFLARIIFVVPVCAHNSPFLALAVFDVWRPICTFGFTEALLSYFRSWGVLGFLSIPLIISAKGWNVCLQMSFRTENAQVHEISNPFFSENRSCISGKPKLRRLDETPMAKPRIKWSI